MKAASSESKAHEEEEFEYNNFYAKDVNIITSIKHKPP